jgi:formamidopyrimidine-DNA glycosylase
MPEGPEVECVRRSLKSIIGKKLLRINLTELSQKYQKYQNKQTQFDQFSGHQIKKIERIGKFLIFKFDKREVILNHLGMSGNWLLIKEKDQILPSHSKVLIEFETLPNVVFYDMRNFGQFKIYENYNSVLQHPPIRKMGIDGLLSTFPLDEFLSRIDKRNYANREIGSVLLDQKLVAGIGNIYKSESLSLANINPTRLVSTLTKKERSRLGHAISKTLHRAVESMGSTFNSFRTPDGGEGSAQNWHQVYGKKDEKCSNCGSEIRRVVQDKRSTFYCPKCQL